MRALETRRIEDVAKINELTDMVRDLSAAVTKLSQSQAAFQEKSLRLLEEGPANNTAAQDSTKGSASSTVEPQAEVEDPEVAKITQMLVNGKYDDATIQVNPNKLHSFN